MELIIMIVRFALRDYWTACSLSAVSKAIRGCIPAIFFRTTVLSAPYSSANRGPRSMIKYDDYSDMENLFITMGVDDKLTWYRKKPKHLCIQLLGISEDIIYRKFAPLPFSLTHLILQVHNYKMSWLLYLLNPKTITHMFVMVIYSPEFHVSLDITLFHSLRLEALVFPAESWDVLEPGFERFLNLLDELPQLQVVGLCPYLLTLDRNPSISYTEMKRSLAGLTHRNASRVVAMPLEDITVSQWYDWLQPDEESVWDKARRLLKEKQESVVKD
ncbi:hypothetical protein BU17DRAFT_85826 [Hysterangium stoloniferum]|nr:hypothetical protein BU17DRAFT_85826 [Hysterangium stoloniferum]